MSKKTAAAHLAAVHTIGSDIAAGEQRQIQKAVQLVLLC